MVAAVAVGARDRKVLLCKPIDTVDTEHSATGVEPGGEGFFHGPTLFDTFSTDRWPGQGQSRLQIDLHRVPKLGQPAMPGDKPMQSGNPTPDGQWAVDARALDHAARTMCDWPAFVRDWALPARVEPINKAWLSCTNRNTGSRTGHVAGRVPDDLATEPDVRSFFQRH
jgi:hypothetical protein